jgi:formylglycine-generating enzyme required for sulfatase activity
MGSNGGSGDEKPVHSVSLSSFYMGASPVTFAVWKEYCAATGTALPEPPSWGWLDDHPVVNVSWDDIMGVDGTGGFCAWASEIAGGRLTLPSEAQWEYAARGGVGGQEFPWGNIFDSNRLWCSGKDLGDAGKTAPVNRSTRIYRNPYGLTDMAGNVWEWCSDLYDAYLSESQTNPTGPSSTSDNVRCVRGGSWLDDDPDVFRCANRGWYYPDSRGYIIGFRLSAGPG